MDEMREIFIIGRYLGHGSRAQVHAAKVGEKRIVLKIYREKEYYKREKQTYEQLSQSRPCSALKMLRYLGPFVLNESVRSGFMFRYGQVGRRYQCYPNPLYRKALAFERFDGVGLHTVIDDMPDASLAQFRKDLTETITALHTTGICHRDIKADNILVAASERGNSGAAIEYVVIDLSEAVLKHQTSDDRWEKLKNVDLLHIREIFGSVRAAKAIRTASVIISSYSNINPDAYTPSQLVIDTQTQLELSRLLELGRPEPGIESLANRIVQTTALIPELCSTIVNIIHTHGHALQALSLVERQLLVQERPCPELHRQKGHILHTLGAQNGQEAAQAYETAISQFTEQLGPRNEMTLSARLEYATFRMYTSDHRRAREMMTDLLAILADQEPGAHWHAEMKARCWRNIRYMDTCPA